MHGLNGLHRVLAVWGLILAPALYADEIETKPLPVAIEPTFTDVTWTGWEPVTENGKPVPFRPVFLTHAGDGSNRLFVVQQQGRIHVLNAGLQPQKSRVLLDISSKTAYADKMNEEGLLGLAFHPKFRDNRYFYIFYTLKEPEHTLVLSRFQVKRDQPDVADPASERELIRFDSKPYWNHNGGTLAFGRDGYLYVAVGDGGLRDDPHAHAQNKQTLFGKVLRLDVDQEAGGKPYGIPADNPFAGKPFVGRGEVYAWGVRNPWRFSFDKETGTLWLADVGQDLWEEINIITKGGNYGWNVREALHPFPPNSTATFKGLTDPIFEYDRKVGKSITGGYVYRGPAVKELTGAYIYADYVSGKIWALRYDADAKKVTHNQPIPTEAPAPIVSFGEDEAGEQYLLQVSGNGKGIYRFKSLPQ